MKRFKHLSFPPDRLLKFIFICMAIMILVLQPGCHTGSSNPNTPGFQGVQPPDYWPTDGWRSTTPEQQGMDSGRLADMLETIAGQNYPIRSVLVIRSGYLVTGAYFHPFEEGFIHIIHSCTKSITSALIGIAIDKGFIQHENTGVLEFFPDYNVANLTGAKQSMTLRHLLMMASGLNARDSYLYDWVGLNNMINSGDWIQYMLDLPMVSSPGSTFDYSNGASYLLAAILQRATQQTAMGFASTNLFSPLGIHNRYLVWPVSPQGVVYGWGGMRMRPTDAAKFGFLYLHKGLWEGNQVISEEWVEKSTRTQINAGTLAEGYGFQWWVDAGGYFMAMGYGGQYIIVNRARNLLVVFTSALKDGDFFLPETLYNQYIFDSIRSDGAIAGNSQQQTRLENVVQRIAHPEPEPVPPLPSTAAVISGKTFYFEPNPYNYEFIGLDFTPGSDEVQLRYFYRDNFPRDFRLPVGLDNVYRTTWEHAYWRSFKGRWEGDSTFVLDYQRAGFTEWGTIRMVFNGNSVNVQFHNQRSGNQWEADAHLRSILPDKLPPPGTALFH